MRILLINTFYYPNMQGGAEQSVKLLAENLLYHGHEVAVFCTDSRDGRNTIEKINGVIVYRYSTEKFDLYRYSYQKSKINAIEKITQKFRCFYNPRVISDFKEVYNKFRPDVIHTNTLYGIPWSVWKSAHKKNIAVVHTIRDTAIISPVQYGHKVSPWIIWGYQKYMCSISKYVDAVTAPSEYTLRTSLETEAFAEAAVKKCVFNSVKIDYDLLHKMIIERKKRETKHIKFLYAGRLIYLKGIKQMIEAFHKNVSNDCELHICGSGELVKYVKDQAQKDSNIVYCGKLTNEELAEQYKECDVLLFPSVWPEPFGRVFIEGNMYGMPVIAGNCGGIPEIYAVTHGGELVNCENLEQLSAAITRFCDRRYLNQIYDKIENTVKVFDINQQIIDFEEIYRRVVKKGN